MKRLIENTIKNINVENLSREEAKDALHYIGLLLDNTNDLDKEVKLLDLQQKIIDSFIRIDMEEVKKVVDKNILNKNDI
ncbi:hypothetical protein [Adhaeribacter aquaticus]|uniref:hypothetical protein n=1 Tax=Adhaeribacter aquaticus TaxID=299567 RepID=UPI000402BD45|nr:hypothetical protein [Adhaeribacter aquaticus]